MTETRPTRADDAIILQVEERVKAMESKLSSITALQNHMLGEIGLEAEDHKFIRIRVQEVSSKLSEIEKSVEELKEDRLERTSQITKVTDGLAELQISLDKVHVCLKALKSGDHAAVHQWAEEKIASEKEQRALRKKIHELLITRAVGAVVLIIFTLLGLGLVSWLKSITHIAP